jgi:hypothetical protein
LVKRVSFDNQVYTLPLMAKEESALKLKTPTGSVAGPADNPQAPSQSSHSSLKSDDENPDDNYVSSQDGMDNQSHVSGATVTDIKSLITVSKKQIYKSSQAKHPLAFRKEHKRLTPSAVAINPAVQAL